MVTSRKDELTPKRPPATTVQARENQLIALAVDEAERQIIAGTASSQILTHYLKLATVREQYEREKLQQETILAKARVESMASSARSEEMFARAIEAMSTYQGRPTEQHET